MDKDWIGGKTSIFSTLGASSHSSKERVENDYYATDPEAVEMLLDLEVIAHDVLEPACGEGHISKVLERHGHAVESYDIVDRGYGGARDFLAGPAVPFDGDIVTNPPYKFAREFVERAIETVTDGHKVVMFLKLQFLEGKARKELFTRTPPPRTVWVSSSRLNCGRNGVFSETSAVAYCWYVWVKGYKGDTVIRWFN